MSTDVSVTDRIKDVERRIEVRRERTARHFDETREEVSRIAVKAASWLPMVAVAGSLAVGFAAARVPLKRAAPVEKTVRPAAARGGIIASILAVGATALRIAASSEARTFWNAVSAFRTRRSEGRAQ